MVRLATRHARTSGRRSRALDQMARELLLAQSSDWAFIMNGTMVEYAVRRTRLHLARFLELSRMVESGRIDEAELRRMEAQDNIFLAMDFRVYCKKKEFVRRSRSIGATNRKMTP